MATTILPNDKSFLEDTVTEGAFKDNFSQMLAYITELSGKVSTNTTALKTANDGITDITKADGKISVALTNAKTYTDGKIGELTVGTGKSKTVENAISFIKQELLEAMYPINSIYMSFVNKAPSHGNWERLKNNYFLMSASSDVSYTNPVVQTFEYTPKGTISKTSLTLNHLPAHNHSLDGVKIGKGGDHVHNISASGDHYHGSAWGEKASVVPNPPYGAIDKTNVVGSSSTDYDNTEFKTSTAGSHIHSMEVSGNHDHAFGPSAKTASTGQSEPATHTHTFTGTKITEKDLHIVPNHYRVYMWRRIS